MTMIRLSDDQMRGFIRDGFLAIKTGLSAEANQEIFDKTEALFGSDGNPGNNLMARIPEVRTVFDDPAVDGALAGVLGDNYFMHPHRHCHYRPPHSEGQQIHKDSFTRRRHHTRWILAMYYPQNTTVDMGPTGVIPGTHYYNWLKGPIGVRERSDGTEGEVPMAVDAGTVLIVHYDIWHRGMGNESDKKRYMMKFMFARMEEPRAPSWDNRESEWVSEGDGGHDAMWSHMWQWHRGAANGHNGGGPGSIPDLIKNMQVDDEATCLDAAYAIGAMGEPAIPALIDTLRHDSEAVRRNATYALTAIGPAAVPALIELVQDNNEGTRTSAIETLADIGLPAKDAVPHLSKALSDSSELVRRNAAEALGTTSQMTSDGVSALASVLTHEDEFLRRNAAIALARIGSGAEAATPALTVALGDHDRYVRGKAAHALRRIGTPEAQDALFHYLTTSQYCYSTNKDSLY
jgi:hypothetical protein